MYVSYFPRILLHLFLCLKQFDWQSFVDALTEGTNVTVTMNDIVFVRNPKYFLELQTQMLNVPLEEFRKNLFMYNYHGAVVKKMF